MVRIDQVQAQVNGGGGCTLTSTVFTTRGVLSTGLIPPCPSRPTFHVEGSPSLFIATTIGSNLVKPSLYRLPATGTANQIA